MLSTNSNSSTPSQSSPFKTGSRFRVTMHCNGCVRTITNMLHSSNLADKVDSVECNLKEQTVTVWGKTDGGKDGCKSGVINAGDVMKILKEGGKECEYIGSSTLHYPTTSFN